MAPRARVYYREEPGGIVIEYHGAEIAVYRSNAEMVETHIKGLLAIIDVDNAEARTLRRKYEKPSST